MTNDLATQLREGTKHSHTMTENTAFMKCFQKGVVEKEYFRKLLANLYYVYGALEESIWRHRNHPLVGNIYFEQLNRKANIEKDLAFYYGENWRDLALPSEMGKIYVDRILEVAENDPKLLIAHAYVRYMGDLSGGQALKNIVRSAMKLPADQGTAFYEFELIPTVEDKRNFKEKYRQALNSLTDNHVEIEAIVTEANYAFSLNRDVVHELEPEVKAAIGDHVFDLLVRQDKPGSTSRNPQLVNQ